MADLTSRAILAANLRRMIERATPEGDKPSVRAWALGKGLDVRLIARLVKEEHAVTLDTLETVADACGLKPWHLLLENVDLSGPAPDAPLSEEDRAMLRKLRRLIGEA